MKVSEVMIDNPPVVTRDDIFGQLFAEDLFEMLDQLSFRPRRPFQF